MFKCAVIIVLTFFYFTPLRLTAQYSNKQIDSLINSTAQNYRQEGKWYEGLLLFNNILQASRENNYQKGIVESCINLANFYYLMGNSTASIQQLDTAIAASNGLTNKILEQRIYSELGKNYFHINQTKKAEEYLKKALSIAAEIKEEQPRLRNIQYIYAILATVYEKNNNISMFYFSLEKAYHTLPNPILASRMTKYYLIYNKNLDSARTYIEKANKMWESGSYPVHQKSIMLRNEGLYHFIIEEYNKAAERYKESIIISKSLGNKEEEAATYKMLSQVHEKLKNPKAQDTALRISLLIADTILKDIAVAEKLPAVASTLRTKEPVKRPLVKKKDSKLWWYLAIIISISLSAISVFYYKLRKRK
ncbi:MAG: tetratricopeptide repeat protein [Sphingobacteriales bacterium]|nr:MAG: tetratricopeptide repeat protein [Sphingobacteriales bacterium]